MVSRRGRDHWGRHPRFDVVHRDLTTANVLFTPGTLKVIHFGVAKAVEAACEHTFSE